MELYNDEAFVFSTTVTPQVLPSSHSDYVPSKADVNGLISSRNAASSTLEAEIQSKRSNIVAFNAFHQHLLSPSIRKLPYELLSKIFAYVCKDQINVGRRRDPIWDLQQVCWQWRVVVQESTLLWNDFELGEMGVCSAVITHRIRSCLKFSGSAPLSIAFSPWFSRVVGIELRRNFKDIMNHANRLFSLRVDVNFLHDAMEHTSSVTSDQQPQFVQLRTLTLILNGTLDCSIYRLLFRNAPALEHLNLENLEMYGVLDGDLPLTNIKRLTINCCCVNERGTSFKFLLSSMPHLEELVFTRIQICCSSDEPFIVTLPSLHTLTVGGSFSSSQFRCSVRVPNLTDLWIGSIWNIDEYLDMIQHSASTIKALYLADCVNINRIMVQACIDRFRNVEELTIGDLNDEIFSFLFYALKWDPSEVNLNKLPYLRNISVPIRISQSPSILKSLESMLVSRSASTPMASVKFNMKTTDISYKILCIYSLKLTLNLF